MKIGNRTLTDIIESFEEIQERKIIVKVNAKGRRRRKIKCPPGRVAKTVNGVTTCVTPSGKERLKKKISIKKSVRTKKARGQGYKKRTNFKRQKAMRKRRSMGL